MQQQQQHKSVRGHSEPCQHALPTHPRSPSDLLMVHAVCGSHTVSVVMLTVDSWLCGMTRV